MAQAMSKSLGMDKYLHGSWREFEQWIRFQIGSDFRWNLSPLDTKILRKDVVDKIRIDLERNEGVLQKGNSFFEKI